MSSRLAISIGTAMLLVGCATIQDLISNRIEKVTPANSEVELAHWAYWDNACQAEPFTVSITQQPTNGEVEIRDAVMAIPTTGCTDTLVESKKVFYVPDQGFTGEDVVTVRFSGSTGTTTNSYGITVE